MKRLAAFSRILVLLIAIPIQVHAIPDHIEVIFLSPPKVSQLLKVIEHEGQIPLSVLTAQASENYDCVPMGDGCFHPQLGFIEDDDSIKDKRKAPPERGDKDYKLKTFNSTDTKLVDCDKNYYFDVFCGKERPLPGRGPVEIWVDTSSSLRNTDFTKDGNFCNRRRFVAPLLDKCGKKLTVSIFDTTKKTIGDLDSLCGTYGTNNGARMVDWIKRSDAKYLLIITDAEEYYGELREFLDIQSAKLFGLDVKPVESKNLMDFVGRVEKTCKKY